MLVLAALVMAALAAPLQGPPTDPRVRALHDLIKKAEQPLERETAALIEPSVRVRVQIVKAFALLADKRPEVPTERVLVGALDDPAPSVVQFGAAGIGNAVLVNHLPRLVPLLRHPNQGVAQAAAGTFNKLAADAGPFIPELQRAADAAPEGPLKQTLLAAIRVARESVRK